MHGLTCVNLAKIFVSLIIYKSLMHFSNGLPFGESFRRRKRKIVGCCVLSLSFLNLPIRNKPNLQPLNLQGHEKQPSFPNVSTCVYQRLGKSRNVYPAHLGSFFSDTFT